VVGHILLIGFMGAGKSTVGRLLADDMGRSFVDLDASIAAAAGKSVARIFQEDGEEAFRAAEHDALMALAPLPSAVVACGGGVVLREDNRLLLRRAGTVVYLQVSAEEALARIGDVSGRPLLAGGGAALAPALLASREALYEACADVMVPTGGRAPSQVAADVADRLKAGAA
jgi:shikimate kinase